MIDSFEMNGYYWTVRMVPSYSPSLVDRTGIRTVATTDPDTLTVNLSEELSGSFLKKVLIHELGHCVMFSYGLLDDIRRMVYPEFRIVIEETICNIIAEYGLQIFRTAFAILGDDAMRIVPIHMGKLIA